MTNLSLSDVTVNDTRTLDKLSNYLRNVSSYRYFDKAMQLRVYVDGEKDFTAVEAVKYRLAFTSTAHKLIDTIRSSYTVDLVSFQDFQDHIDALADYIIA